MSDKIEIPHVIIPPLLVIQVLLLGAVYAIGAEMESRRIYNKCLERNNLLIYQEAKKICEEVRK